MGKYNRAFEYSGSDDYYGANPYYSPEKCGLTLLATLDVHDLSYEYDTIIVTKDTETGAIFMAHDSGCSCPTPFEEIRGLEDMTRIKSVKDFDKFMEGYNVGPYNEEDPYSYRFDENEVGRVRSQVDRYFQGINVRPIKFEVW